MIELNDIIICMNCILYIITIDIIVYTNKFKRKDANDDKFNYFIVKAFSLIIMLIVKSYLEIEIHTNTAYNVTDCNITQQ